jgi:hydroxymethylglutaryl-CoA lyase
VSDLPTRISIREVGPRDGLQNEEPVPTQAKIALIDRLSATGVQRIEAVVSASDTHNRKNVNRGTAESLDDIAGIIAQAHRRESSCQVIVSTAWGCPFEGDVPVARVVRIAGRAVADGADSISFGDTTGMATPSRVRSLVGEFRSAYPDTP